MVAMQAAMPWCFKQRQEAAAPETVAGLASAWAWL